jgi:hypothetical protein
MNFIFFSSERAANGITDKKEINKNLFINLLK